MDKFVLGEIIAKVVRVQGAPLEQVDRKAQEILPVLEEASQIEEALMIFFERGGAP